MGRSDVEVRFEAQLGTMGQVLTQAEKKIEKLGNQLAAMSKKGNRSAKSMQANFVRTGKSIIVGAVAAAGLTSALSASLHAARELRMESERFAISLDKSAKKLQIQAGLTDLQSEKAQERTAVIAKRTGFAPEAINRITTELVSQGFKTPLQSGTTEAMIAFLQASNKGQEENLEEFVAAFSQQLKAGSKKKIGKNVLELALRVRGVFKETPFQAQDLIEFSQVKSVATDLGISDEDFLSAAVILKAKVGSSAGKTGLKNTLLRLAAPEGSGVKAFKKLGLDKTEVDFIGETLPEVLKLLNERIAALPEEERLPVLKQIFGQKTLVSALGLLAGRKEGEFKRIAEFQRDRKGFEKGVKDARQGLAAGIGKAESEAKELQRQVVAEGQITLEEIQEQKKIVQLRRQKGGLNIGERFLNLFEDIQFGQASLGLTPLSGTAQQQLTPEVRQEILARRKSNFILTELEQKAGIRNAKQPVKVGVAGDFLQNAVQEDRQNPLRPVAGPAAGPGPDLANQKTQTELLRVMEEVRDKLPENTAPAKRKTGAARNAHR